MGKKKTIIRQLLVARYLTDKQILDGSKKLSEFASQLGLSSEEVKKAGKILASLGANY